MPCYAFPRPYNGLVSSFLKIVTLYQAETEVGAQGPIFDYVARILKTPGIDLAYCIYLAVLLLKFLRIR